MDQLKGLALISAGTDSLSAVPADNSSPSPANAFERAALRNSLRVKGEHNKTGEDVDSIRLLPKPMIFPVRVESMDSHFQLLMFWNTLCKENSRISNADLELFNKSYHISNDKHDINKDKFIPSVQISNGKKIFFQCEYYSISIFFSLLYF
jgi:hypothetical protein